MGPVAVISSALVAAAISQPVFALNERTSIPEAQTVINNLKAKITKDPMGFTKTWDDICADNYTLFCDASPLTGEQALTVIDFNEANFEGDGLTYDFLVDLEDLTLLHANSNGFTGSLPIDFMGLGGLAEIDVSNNKLSGPFPAGVLTAPSLTWLELRFNAFEGELPSALFDLGLVALFLNDNNFSGQLPSNVWATPAEYVTLANNDFSQSIPELTASNNLKEVLLLGNRFTGGVPESLCAQPTLEVLDVSDNFLTAPLGSACAALVEKGVLEVSQNCISGLENQRSLTSPECQVLTNQI